jgi:hypothetical protein
MVAVARASRLAAVARSVRLHVRVRASMCRSFFTCSMREMTWHSLGVGVGIRVTVRVRIRVEVRIRVRVRARARVRVGVRVGVGVGVRVEHAAEDLAEQRASSRPSCEEVDEGGRHRVHVEGGAEEAVARIGRERQQLHLLEGRVRVGQDRVRVGLGWGLGLGLGLG